MGADLTINHPSIAAAEKLHRAEFDRLIAERNAIGVPEVAAGSIHLYLNGYTPYRDLAPEAKKFLRTDAGKALKLVYKAIDKNMATQPGYFRDSYNNSSIMWRLDLSWWAIAGVGNTKSIQLIDDKGTMSLPAIFALREAVKAATLRPFVQGASVPRKLPGDHDLSFRARLRMQEWIDSMSASEVKKWNAFFVSKRRKLVAFLTQALKLKATIDASV